jgi:hypothetical protein
MTTEIISNSRTDIWAVGIWFNHEKQVQFTDFPIVGWVVEGQAARPVVPIPFDGANGTLGVLLSDGVVFFGDLRYASRGEFVEEMTKRVPEILQGLADRDAAAIAASHKAARDARKAKQSKRTKVGAKRGRRYG